MSQRGKLPTANLILDILADIHDSDGPQKEIQIKVICKAIGRPREDVYKLLTALQQLDAVCIDPKVDSVLLTESGYAMARPGDVTWPVASLSR
jgi:DNA-binding IclR family transcriptional regulator